MNDETLSVLRAPNQVLTYPPTLLSYHNYHVVPWHSESANLYNLNSVSVNYFFSKACFNATTEIFSKALKYWKRKIVIETKVVTEQRVLQQQSPTTSPRDGDTVDKSDFEVGQLNSVCIISQTHCCDLVYLVCSKDK